MIAESEAVMASWRMTGPVIATLLLPILVMIWVGLPLSGSWVEWGLRILLCLCFAVAWSMIWPTVYLGYIWQGLVYAGLAAAVFIAYRRMQLCPPTALQIGNIVLLLACIAGLSRCIVKTAMGYIAPPNCLSLMFPFRDGTYNAFNAAGSLFTNLHRVPNQKYGIDFIGINRLGMQAANPFSNRSSEYAIFGATLLSPCDGIILRAHDGEEDLSAGEIPQVNTAGNFILIRHGQYKILLGHLKKGSVRVAVGEQVAAGQAIAQIGNSGMSTMPHLHMSVATGGAPNEPYDGIGAAFVFDGRFLVRNSLVRTAG